ncbi:MAG: hypothetical protein OXF41_15520 [bacterium]|nr:hypothetical protein [bacterium]
MSRCENDLRDPSGTLLEELASALGVTVELLRSAGRMEGALAVGAHMRRRATARPTVWRRLEAQLNLARLHCRQLADRIDLDTDLTIPWFDPFEFDPATAARLLRAEWRMPDGPVRDLIGWMEAAGCFVLEVGERLRYQEGGRALPMGAYVLGHHDQRDGADRPQTADPRPRIGASVPSQPGSTRRCRNMRVLADALAVFLGEHGSRLSDAESFVWWLDRADR